MFLQKLRCFPFPCRYLKFSENKSSKVVRKCYHKNATTDKILSNVDKTKLDQGLAKSICSHLKQTGYIYINDPVSADLIASHLGANWKEGYIFEANPGPGILSNAILKAGVPHLRVFERNEEFLPALKNLSDMNTNFEVLEEDFLFLPILEARHSNNCRNVLNSFFNDIPEYSWNEGVPFRLFSIISSVRSIKFLRYLLLTLPTRPSIFSFGRCELFLLLSKLEYMYIKAKPKEKFSTYRWSTVLYNLFFEIEYLDEFSSEIFHPLPSTCGKKKNQGSQFYLVRLTPKPDLFTSVVNCNKLPDFYFFIRHHLARRTGPVIPIMERWVPYCGPRLIKEGMTVFTKFGDLSPLQLLMLFNQFSSWTEYEDSPFRAAVQSFNEKRYSSYKDEDNASKISFSI